MQIQAIKELVDIQGKESKELEVFKISDFDSITCIGHVLKNYKSIAKGVKSGILSNGSKEEEFIVVETKTNSITMQGTNQRELIEAKLIKKTDYEKLKDVKKLKDVENGSTT